MERTSYLPGNRKTAIIGAGYVGASIAYALTLRDIARQIVLIDIDREKAEGEAADIRHGVQSLGTADVFAGTYADCADCDLIIITAGRGRRPGETRLDLASENIAIMRGVIDELQKHYTRGVILIISNPVDILTARVTEWMGLPDGRVFSSGCTLDSSRFVSAIADHVGLSTGAVCGYVVGEHGDGQVPVWSHVTVGGVPIAEYCAEVGIPWDEDVRARIAAETRGLGAQIIRAKGRTHFGIATCVCQLASAVIDQRPTVASVSTVLRGEYGIRGTALSMPSVVGGGGVQLRIRERWEAEERRRFHASADALGEMLAKLP